MPSLPLDVVVFDLDGTLADTSPDLAAALNHTLRTLGRPEVAVGKVRDLIGHGARAMLRRGLAASGDAAEASVDAAFPIFLDFYRANIARGSRAHDGVDEALAGLAGAGIALAVCTNKLESLTLPLLDELGWSDRFDVVIGGDTLPWRKPDPAPLREAIARAGGGRAVLVGDSVTDADTARAAAIPFVAVSFGFSDRPVGELGARAVIDRYDQLLPALASL
jgi:phosphoglycolate phosphatase